MMHRCGRFIGMSSATVLQHCLLAHAEDNSSDAALLYAAYTVGHGWFLLQQACQLPATNSDE